MLGTRYSGEDGKAVVWRVSESEPRSVMQVSFRFFAFAAMPYSLLISLGKLNYNSLVSNPIINRSVPQILPSFCNLSLSTKCRWRGLYARCDIFSCNYALPSGAPPTTSCPDRRRQHIWRLCRLEGCYSYMWQSHVEIEGYSVVYFDCIPAPYRWSSIKGGAQRAL